MTVAQTLEEQIEQANAGGSTPVVFIHGLWLLASSWDRWAGHFAEAGYAPVSPGWPDDPDEDIAGDAWAGVIPMSVAYGAPLAAPDLRPGIPVPASVRAMTKA